jgi:hypothetical protein
VLLRPTYRRNASREYVFQLPDTRRARGVLLLAPGCHQRAVDYWDKTEACQECIGAYSYSIGAFVTPDASRRDLQTFKRRVTTAPYFTCPSTMTKSATAPTNSCLCFWGLRKGLPEQKKIARAALRQGLALLAVSPGGKGQSAACWDTRASDIDASTDLHPVRAPFHDLHHSATCTPQPNNDHQQLHPKAQSNAFPTHYLPVTNLTGPLRPLPPPR